MHLRQKGVKRYISLLCFLGAVLLSFLPAKAQSDSIQGRVVPPRNKEEVEAQPLIDLKLPTQLKSGFIYDAATGKYLFVTTLNGKRIGTPIAYTQEEYLAYLKRNENVHYFRDKEREEAAQEGKKQFNPFDFGFELGPAERVFGPGGVKVRTQGSAELLFSAKTNATDNPSLPEHARKHTYFDFDEKIQANVQASVGSKLNFNLNYNTETTFDFDARKLKLAYEGEEDDIVKLVEAGSVALHPQNSLIQGGASLFGIHTKLQFGKLDLSLVVSQQEAETKRVSSQGGVQTTPFEFSANQYDEGRHFFLSKWFYDHYDEALKTLPYISGGVVINRVEVWVTNKRGRFDDARNIVAFSDLAEAGKTYNSRWTRTGDMPANDANSLYQTMIGMPALRRIEQVTQTLSPILEGGTEYEKLESARLLAPSEYTLNASLGYISLNAKLNGDEVLAVAFEYTYRGKVYQVGEFSTDRPDNGSETLFVKLVKGTKMTPASPYWRLMMRNVYALGANVQGLTKERFRLDILYRSDSTGIALPYITESPIKGQLLVKSLEMDRLDSRNERYPDGVFDYVEGYTVNSRRGWIYFSTVEPFGKTLADKIGDPALADKYVYRAIYDTTANAAREVAEKDKFLLKGEYKASQSGQISLGAMGVTPGSVRVTAGGAVLTENVDYTVNYAMGTVTIINESILSSGTRVDVSLENKGFLNLQRKTMLGADLNYHFTKDFTLGATAMYLSEMPLTTKTTIGDESMRNFLWGANLSYRTKWQGLTNLLDKIPFLNLTKPSEIAINAEFAHLIPGHYEGRYAKGYSYIDDFESSQGQIDLKNPYAWTLASTPFQDTPNPLFPEASFTNDVRYGEHRALLAWFYIDPILNRSRSSMLPSYIRNDPDYLSNHYSREVSMLELFPYRDYNQAQLSYLQTFNVSYYPAERGPYNLNYTDLLPDGTFANPDRNWGGIMRKIDQSDFEAANIEYIEFWLMDPFIYNRETTSGGELYLNLGEISEDILKDGLKYFENGMPLNDDAKATRTTVWGKVPTRQASGYAFDNSPGARAKQDVGLNGLNDEEEAAFPAYVEYLQGLRSKISAETAERWKSNPMSPFTDPAGDNFKHYRNKDWDEERAPILDRYRYFNGVQGNSAEAKDAAEAYSIASRVMPDVEDVNQDNTLNENESYFQYHIVLRPDRLAVGQNYITDVRSTAVTLANGKKESVNWYQFKIPLKEYEAAIGGIADFKSIRFMRLFLTGFKEATHLRFGTFKLVRGEWRSYDRELHDPNVTPISKGTLEVSTVNIEENGDRQPINYVLPPTVTRSLDPAQAQATQQNEQSLSLRIRSLSPADARAIYRNMGLDLRRYKRLELFVHGEALLDDDTQTENGDLSVFIRLGSDYRNNYYEYAVPLSLTPYGVYSSDLAQDRAAVWPAANKIQFPFKQLTDLKIARNSHVSTGGADYYKRYSAPDEGNPANTISIVGNPSLSNVKTIMIGVRNNSGKVKSAEVWVNELRLSDYQEHGGWAANTDVQVQLSDWGSFNARGVVQTAGFGALDQTLSQRRLEDLRQVNLSTRLELGRFFPEKAAVSIPFYYAYNDEQITPQYNPLDEDLLLKDALKGAPSKQQRDSILVHSVTRTRVHSISLSNVHVGIKSKTPMPYDPANFSVSYALNKTDHHTPELTYDNRRDWQFSATYDYQPVVPPLKPFGWIKAKDPQLKALQSYRINWLPSKINLSSSLLRNYNEQQVRNYIPGIGDATPMPATFVRDFVWNRALTLNWNLTDDIQFSFQSGTNARIEEPNVQVNRRLNPDAWGVWRDSVNQSIRQLGLPMKYDQRASLNWKLPISLIPYMSWVTANVNYTGTYNWDRGAILSDDNQMGNLIRNDLRLEGNATLAFNSLYALIPYLANVDKRISAIGQSYQTSSRRSRFNRAQGTENSYSARMQNPTKPRRFEQTVTLSTDSVTTIRHGLGSKKIRISATDSLGRRYTIKYKVKDTQTIQITNRDSAKLKLTIADATKRNAAGNETARFTDFLVYPLMMLKDVQVSYSRNQGFNLPGFLPAVRAAGGQAAASPGLAPGLDFAFGFVDHNWIERASERGWLTTAQDNVRPSSYTQSENFSLRISLEPIKELRITLNALRNDTRREETQYVFSGMPRTFGGSFTMTTVGFKHFFFTPNGNSGYSSPNFDNLLAYRSIMRARIADAYRQAGATNVTAVRENGADVLIPAFLAAYTSASPERVALTPFPAFSALLPNWTINYTGLNLIPGFDKVFRNFSLSHNYTATYSVGGYSSFLGWKPLSEGNELGFVQRVAPTDPNASGTQELIPSMPYDIPSVTFQEGFNPLIGVEVTLTNGITASARWNRRRAVTLNLTAVQLMENNANELTASLSYKVDDAAKLFGIKKRNRTTRPRTNGKSASGNNNQQLFASGGSMTLRADYTYNRSSMLIRKIQDNFTQATNGNIAQTLKLSADYALSRMLTLRAFFDWNINHPLVSSASFPTRNTNFGVALRINLTQ